MLTYEQNLTIARTRYNYSLVVAEYYEMFPYAYDDFADLYDDFYEYGLLRTYCEPLPAELMNRILLFHSHPVADLIREEIESFEPKNPFYKVWKRWFQSYHKFCDKHKGYVYDDDAMIKFPIGTVGFLEGGNMCNSKCKSAYHASMQMSFKKSQVDRMEKQVTRWMADNSYLTDQLKTNLIMLENEKTHNKYLNAELKEQSAQCIRQSQLILKLNKEIHYKDEFAGYETADEIEKKA